MKGRALEVLRGQGSWVLLWRSVRGVNSDEVISNRGRHLAKWGEWLSSVAGGEPGVQVRGACGRSEKSSCK